MIHLLLMAEFLLVKFYGESVDIPLDDAGFYRLYDPDYPWMKIVAYVFPHSDSLTFGNGQNLGN